MQKQIVLPGAVDRAITKHREACADAERALIQYMIAPIPHDGPQAIAKDKATAAMLEAENVLRFAIWTALTEAMRPRPKRPREGT